MLKIATYILASCLFAYPLFGQIIQIHEKQATEHFDNIKVEKLYSDSLVTSSLIWVKEQVRLHKHALHTEQVYILQGKALMIIGDTLHKIKKGDWIIIPKNTPHAVTKVYGRKPLKVISIQAPVFQGKDRLFLEN